MTKRKSKTPNLFLVMWCTEGLESIIPITELEEENRQYEKERAWRALADKEEENPAGATLGRLLRGMTLRARYNPQRFYEIYSIQTTPGLTEENLRHFFEDDPQGAADLIRERGNKIWGKRRGKNTVIT